MIASIAIIEYRDECEACGVPQDRIIQLEQVIQKFQKGNARYSSYQITGSNSWQIVVHAGA